MIAAFFSNNKKKSTSKLYLKWGAYKRNKIFDWCSLWSKLRVLLSQVNNPAKNSRELISKLQVNNFSEYGHNHSAYNDLTDKNIILENDEMLVASINSILDKPISTLDLSEWQKNKLVNEAGLSTIKELINTSEQDLINKLEQVGVVRSRQMKNAAYAELLEYISG